MSIETDEFLEHFGIKGMHWGVTRSIGSSGRVTGSSKPAANREIKPSAEFKKTRKILEKDPSEMTNKQLTELNNRLNLEQNYTRLTAKQPGPIKRGRSHATEALATIGVGVSVYNLVKSPAGQAFIKTAKKVIFRSANLIRDTKAITG